VISKRYEKASIILTSNKTFGEWGQVFGGEVLATAIVDRLLHHCGVISINGPRYRLKNRLRANERENEVGDVRTSSQAGTEGPGHLTPTASIRHGTQGCYVLIPWHGVQ
jgi:hypothetical protein